MDDVEAASINVTNDRGLSLGTSSSPAGALSHPGSPPDNVNIIYGRHASHSADSNSDSRIIRQYELIERVRSYDPDLDERRLNKAYIYAVKMHGEQKRASGDPYFAHPVAVAGLLADLKLDVDTIIAGLLHDTVEDTDATCEDIANLFGHSVAELVDGLTKLSLLTYHSEQSKQAANFQKLILATTKDLRVLLVKLADRLHNMRTLHFIKKEEKRLRISRETMEIYAPLAMRIGLYRFASELEDLAFMHINPEARNALILRLQEMEDDSRTDMNMFADRLENLLFESGIDAYVYGRRKNPYSIWRKLEHKDIAFKDIADLLAFRIITKSNADCYHILGLVHAQWRYLPDRFHDFISTPKLNGYRSIHTVIHVRGHRRVELQIRTEEMDDSATRGIAAHWRYKNSSYGFDPDSARAQGIDPEASLQAFADIIQHGADPEEFLEHAKLEMYHDHTFTFTPKGRLIVLPSGAMSLDFAYAVHTGLGDMCVGTKINGEERPLRTVLKNGDIVEIIRAEHPVIRPGWESLVITGRARSGVMRLMRSRRREAFVALGQRLFLHALRRIELDINDIDMDEALLRVKQPSFETLYEVIGAGELSTDDVLSAIFPDRAHQIQEMVSRNVMSEADAHELITGSGLTHGISIHFSECCKPIPGDRIIGLHEPGKGLMIHTIDCPTLADFDDRPEHWVDLQWTPLASGSLGESRICVTAANRAGVLAILCRTIAEGSGNITEIKTLNRSNDYTDLVFDIEVESLKHITKILSALRALTDVDNAIRFRG